MHILATAPLHWATLHAQAGMKAQEPTESYNVRTTALFDDTAVLGNVEGGTQAVGPLCAAC